MKQMSSGLLILIVGCGGTAASTSAHHPEGSPENTDTAVAAPASLPEGEGSVEGAPALMPVGLTSFGAAIRDNSLYVLGGFFGTPHNYVPQHQSRAMLRLSLEEEAEWETIGALERGLQSVALVAVGEGLHRIGGMRVTAPGELSSVAEHERYRQGRWEALPALPEPRSSHDAIAVGDSIFVVGGWKLAGNPRDGRFYDDMLVYSDEGGWESREAPIRRRALAVAATDSHVIAIGGLDPQGEVSEQVDLYDVNDRTWSRGPSLPGERNGFGVAAVGTEGRFFASGRDGIVWSIAPGEGEWTRLGELTFPRFFHRFVSPEPGVLLAVGGISGMHTFGRTRHVETFRVDGEQESSVALFTLPNPGPAKNRQGVFLMEDDLVLFGGNRSLGQHDFEPEHFVDGAFALHLASLTHRPIASYPSRRQTMQTLVRQGQGVSVGGFGHDGNVARTHPEAYTYDPEANTWRQRPGLPVARSQFGLVEHGGSLWVFGGLDYDPSRPEADRFRHLTEVLRAPADESAPFAAASVELPGPRRAFGGAVFEGRYYLVGGMREGFELVEDCKSFDFGSESWSNIACPEHVRLNPQLTRVGGRLVLSGGTTKLGEDLVEDRSIEVYDPATNEWSVASVELPFTPRHMRAFEYRGRLLIYSAHNEEGVIQIGLITLGAAT